MKNFIKKVIVVALIGLMIVPPTVFAEGIPVLNIKASTSDIVVGKEFEVKLTFDESEKVNTDIKLTFDSTLVELVDDGMQTLVQGTTPSTVDKKKTGEVFWTNIKNAGLSLKFKALKTGEFNFKGVVPDAYLFSLKRKATAEELVKLTADQKITIKEANNTTKENKENKVVEDKSTTNNKSEVTSTGFFSSLIDGLKQDWTLRILFIAVVLILILLVVFLLEAIVKRGKKPKEDEVDTFSPENLLSELSDKRERNIRKQSEAFELDSVHQVKNSAYNRNSKPNQVDVAGESKPLPKRRVKLDENGNPIRRIKLDENGNPIRKIKLDENGNPIRKIKRDANGNPIRKK